MNTKQNQTPLSNWQNWDPGNKFEVPGIVVAVGVLSAWPLINLFGISAVLCITLALFLSLLTFLYIVATSLTFKHQAWIKLALIASILLTALLDALVFEFKLVRFFLLDWAILAFYATALLLGLWNAFFNWQKALTAVAAVVLLVAPFTPEITENEKWTIKLHVWDEKCQPLKLAASGCEAAAIARLKDLVINTETALNLTDDNGETEFEISGNPLLKGAACTATRLSDGNGPAYPPRSTFVAAPFVGSAVASIQLVPDGASEPASGNCADEHGR